MTSCAGAGAGVATSPSGSAASPSIPQDRGQGIVDAVTGEVLTPAQAAAHLVGPRVVYVAEQPGLRLHNEVQLQVVRAMLAAGARPAIGLQMVAPDRQDALDRWISRQLPETQLAEALRWSERWPHPIEHTLPVLRLARAHGLPLVALGAAPADDDAAVEAPEPSRERRSYLRHVYAHRKPAGVAPEAFVKAEALRDALMARRVEDSLASHDRPLVVLASRARVEYGGGVPLLAFDRTGEPFRVVLPIVRGHLGRYHRWLRKLRYPDKRADLFWESTEDPHERKGHERHHHHDAPWI